MRYVLLVILIAVTPSMGCRVFRKTAVDDHVALSRDLTLQGLESTSLQDPAAAEKYFAEAIDWDPENVEARLHLAETYRLRGEVAAAIRQLEACRQIAPGHQTTAVKLGQCYSESENVARAYRLAQEVLRQDRDSVEGWNLRGRALWQMGRLPEALADFQQALRVEPGNFEIREQMAALYGEMQKPQRALTTLDRVAEEFKNDEIPERILVKQATALRQLNRTDEAIARLENGFERPQFSETLATAYVAALLEGNQTEKAFSAIQVARARFPNNRNLYQWAKQLEPAATNRLASQNNGFFQ